MLGIDLVCGREKVGGRNREEVIVVSVILGRYFILNCWVVCGIMIDFSLRCWRIIWFVIVG